MASYLILNDNNFRVTLSANTHDHAYKIINMLVFIFHQLLQNLYSICPLKVLNSDRFFTASLAFNFTYH